MTIYSHHPNRGKVQILATYRSRGSVESSTVTSIDDTTLADPIVNALNRVSTYATMPLIVSDSRGDSGGEYPVEHLTALIDRNSRAELLVGTHSLWYEQVKMLLHTALADLDNALSYVPAPVRVAINAELEAEGRGLRNAWAEVSEKFNRTGLENDRCWDINEPLMVLGVDLDGLRRSAREHLNRIEEGATTQRVVQGIADLRLLAAAHARSTRAGFLVCDDFAISDDPFDSGPDRFYLNVQAPMPNGDYGRESWEVVLGQWHPDDPEDEDSIETGEPVLVCSRAEPPTIDEIVELLSRSGGQVEQLAAWAKTAVGETLAGTAFVVTKRYDDRGLLDRSRRPSTPSVS